MLTLTGGCGRVNEFQAFLISLSARSSGGRDRRPLPDRNRPATGSPGPPP